MQDVADLLCVLEKWREKMKSFLIIFLRPSDWHKQLVHSISTTKKTVDGRTELIARDSASGGGKERQNALLQHFPKRFLAERNPKWQNGIDKNIFIESIFIFHLLAFDCEDWGGLWEFLWGILDHF